MENTVSQALNDLLVTRDFEPKALDGVTGLPPVNDQGEPDPSKADMFSFDYKTESQNYGTVVILLGKKNNMTVYYGDNVGRAMEGNDKREWYQFLQQLKKFATRNLLRFELDNISKLKYTMQGMAAIKEGLFEGYYGKKNISYSDQPKQVRLIIKHNRNILEGEPRYRAIESLFVETADGERFKVPSRSLAHGKMIARHVAEGGNPYDVFGQHINSIVAEMSTLSRFIRAAHSKQFQGPAAELVEAAVRHYSDLKAKAKQMISQRGYREARELFDPAEITETEATVDAVRNMFIEQTLDQRIEEALPILVKLKGTNMKEADEFESWANQVMEGTWALPDTPETQRQLQDLMSKPLMVGADATNATEQLYDLIGDDILFDRLGDLADRDPNANCWEDPGVINRLGELGIDINPTVGPDSNEQGMTEGSDRVDSLVTNGLKIMRGPTWLDAVAAIKYQVGERDYRERKEFYDFFVKQLVDRYGKKPVAEEEEDKIDSRFKKTEWMPLMDAIKILKHYGATPEKYMGHEMFPYYDIEGNRKYLEDITWNADNSKNVRVSLVNQAVRELKAQQQGLSEGHETSSVASALTRKIMSQRLDLLKKYGPVKVTQAIDDAAEFFGDVEEIGSSDMNAYMQYVEKALGGMNEQGLAEGTSRGIMLNGKEIDMRSLEIEDVYPGDYPDFSDAYIGRASFTDGTDLSDQELDQLNDEHSDLVHELAYDSLHESDLGEDLDTDGVMMTKPSNMSSESVDPVLRLKQMLKH